jgi:hypothetical protein
MGALPEGRNDTLMQIFETPQRDPLFFMHIPKTAGMSMRAYLSDQYSPLVTCPANTWAAASQLDRSLASYRLVQGHFQYNLRAALQPGTKVVAVVREPLARTLSALSHLRRDPAFHADHAVAKDLSLKQVLRTPYLMRRQQNVQAASLCASVPPETVLAQLRQNRPNFDAAELEEAPSLPLALERAGKIEFLGSTANLWLLLHQTSESLGLHPAAGLPLINNAPGQALMLDTLNAEDLELLRSYNQIDIPLYERCLEVIEQREFQRLMLSMITRGIYKRMAGSFEIDLSEPVPGSGWYSPETQSGRTWRWTGPDSRFTLEVPLQASGRYKVSVRFGGRALGPNSMAARANGHELRIALSQSGSSYEAMVELGPDILEEAAGCCRLVLDLGSTTRATGKDLRPLGAAVNKVSFERLD